MASNSILDYFAAAADLCGDSRQARRHRFRQCQAEGFVFGQMNQDVQRGQQRGNVIPSPGEQQVVLESTSLRQLDQICGRSLFPFTPDEHKVY